MMNINTTTILVATGALLVGGVSAAAFMNNRSHGQDYADVVKVAPVTQREPQYATVIGSDPIREISNSSMPREVCRDIVVHERLPERDGNVGGTVVGALAGGLIGSRFGHGGGREAMTAAGLVTGGMIGHEIDREHVGGRVVERSERRCHTETAMSQSSHVVGYTVTYRNPDGTIGTMRMAGEPGDRVLLGDAETVAGYDVTYRYDGYEKTIRMNEKPVGDRLPVVNGQLVAQATPVVSMGTTRQ